MITELHIIVRLLIEKIKLAVPEEKKPVIISLCVDSPVLSVEMKSNKEYAKISFWATDELESSVLKSCNNSWKISREFENQILDIIKPYYPFLHKYGSFYTHFY